MIRRVLFCIALLLATAITADARIVKGARIPAIGSGQIAVTYIAPLTLSDNSAASGQTGSTVHWDTTSRVGQSITAYANSAVVSGAGLTYTILSLLPATYYVCVSATSAAGESECDYEQTIVVP